MKSSIAIAALTTLGITLGGSSVFAHEANTEGTNSTAAVSVTHTDGTKLKSHRVKRMKSDAKTTTSVSSGDRDNNDANNMKTSKDSRSSAMDVDANNMMNNKGGVGLNTSTSNDANNMKGGSSSLKP